MSHYFPRKSIVSENSDEKKIVKAYKILLPLPLEASTGITDRHSKHMTPDICLPKNITLDEYQRTHKRILPKKHTRESSHIILYFRKLPFIKDHKREKSKPSPHDKP